MVFRSQGSLCSVNVAIQTGPSKVRVVGSNPGTGSFFSSFLFLHFFPFLSLYRAFTQVYARLWAGSCAFFGGPSYHRLQP